MIPITITEDMTTQYRECVAGVGSTIDLTGGVRRYAVFCRGGDVHIRAGAALVPADVVVAGATLSPYLPENGWSIVVTTSTRVVLMPAAGTTHVYWTELAQ